MKCESVSPLVFTYFHLQRESAQMSGWRHVILRWGRKRSLTIANFYLLWGGFQKDGKHKWTRDLSCDSWEREAVSDWWHKNTQRIWISKDWVHMRSTDTSTHQRVRTRAHWQQLRVDTVLLTAYLSGVQRYSLGADVLIPVFARWLWACLGRKRRWSPIRCHRGWSRASSTASVQLPELSGKLFSSRSWSFISAGLYPTTRSCSAACSRSESGETCLPSGIAALMTQERTE